MFEIFEDFNKNIAAGEKQRGGGSSEIQTGRQRQSGVRAVDAAGVVPLRLRSGGAPRLQNNAQLPSSRAARGQRRTAGVARFVPAAGHDQGCSETLPARLPTYHSSSQPGPSGSLASDTYPQQVGIFASYMPLCNMNLM